jgi:uncharacterized protein (DUF488 family)
MIYTIGHSTKPQQELIDLLQLYKVRVLVDVRTIPRSRHNPQFNREELEKAIPAAKIEYFHYPQLGGLRRPIKNSPNQGWKHSGFRGFADYMMTGEFERALQWLMETSKKKQSAIMCAEAVYWRCHRMLISDALTVQKIEVRHILNARRAELHKVTNFAKVDGVKVTYPPEQPDLNF